jgi:Carbohydrate-binding family 9
VVHSLRTIPEIDYPASVLFRLSGDHDTFLARCDMRRFFLGLLALAAAGFSRGEAADGAEGPAVPGETKRVRWASAPAVKQNTYRVQRMKENAVIDADWNKAPWKGITPVTLEYYMGKEPAHQPKAQAKAAYDDQFLHFIWKVEDNYVLARRTEHQQDVWCDSCVEFFFTPGGDPKERGYFNLETNCTGVKLFGIHVAGSKEEGKLTAGEFESIVTASSLKGPIAPEVERPTTWTLEYKIPLSLLEKYGKIERPKPGVTWRGNFYKCADDSSRPHWLTWSPVTNAEPSFHLPQYFGVLTFE